MRSQTKKKYIVFMLLTAGVVFTLTSLARHHNRQNPTTPSSSFSDHTQRSGNESNQNGKFDYYLLSLSWSPAFCLLNSDRAPEEQCGTKRFGFIVHGLWPQYQQGYPSDCDLNPPSIPETVTQEVLPIMPSRDLIRHEWQKHGTCSGLSVTDYFRNIEKAYASVNIPPELKLLQTPLRIAPSEIADRFMQSNQNLPVNSTIVNCKNGKLTQIEICMDKALKPITCSFDVLKSQCKSQTVLIPPLR